MRWAGHVCHVGDMRDACRVWVGRSEGKGPLGRDGHSSMDNIKLGLRVTGSIWLRTMTDSRRLFMYQ